MLLIDKPVHACYCVYFSLHTVVKIRSQKKENFPKKTFHLTLRYKNFKFLRDIPHSSKRHYHKTAVYFNQKLFAFALLYFTIF